MATFSEKEETPTPTLNESLTTSFGETLRLTTTEFSIITIPPFVYTLAEDGISIKGTIVPTPKTTEWWLQPHTLHADGIHIANITLPYPPESSEPSSTASSVEPTAFSSPTSTISPDTSAPAKTNPSLTGSPPITGSKKEIIVGAAVGSVAFIFMAAAGIFIAHRQRRSQKATLSLSSSPTEGTTPPLTEKSSLGNVEITSAV